MSIEARRLRDDTRRYDVKLRDPDGHHYKRTFRTRKDAEAFEARERADRSRGTWIDPRSADATFEDWARQWLDNPGKRPTTLARDETILRRHILPTIGTRPLGSVTPKDVRALVAHWTGRYAPRTVRRHYDVVRAVFASAVESDLIARTPCRAVSLPSVDPLERPQIDADDLAGLVEALPVEHRAMTYLGAVLGLRWAECAGLRVGRIDFLRGTLTVAVQRTHGPGGLMVEGPPKSKAGRRTLSVPRALLDLLSEHLARRGLTAADADAYVFVTSVQGAPLEYSGWRRRVWYPARKAAGLDWLQFHDLRRASATALVAEGVDVKTAQARLGHSDPRLTLAIYAQATSEADKVAADRVGDRFMQTMGRKPESVPVARTP